MKRKDIEAALAEDPQTVFSVEEWRGHTSLALVAGFVEARQTGGRWNPTTTPARVLIRRIHVGDWRNSYYYEDEDEDEDGAEEALKAELESQGFIIGDGYWITSAEDPAGWKPGVTFGKILSVRGSLSEWFPKHLAESRRLADEHQRALQRREAVSQRLAGLLPEGLHLYNASTHGLNLHGSVEDFERLANLLAEQAQYADGV